MQPRPPAPVVPFVPMAQPLQQPSLPQHIVSLIAARNTSELMSLLHGQHPQLLSHPITVYNNQPEWVLTLAIRAGDSALLREVTNLYVHRFGPDIKNIFIGREDHLFLLTRNPESVHVLGNAFSWTQEFYQAQAKSAVLRNDYDVLVKCHQLGANLNARYDGYKTLMHYAVELDGTDEIVKYLGMNGADLNAKDRDGVTPVAVSERTGKKRGLLAKLLMTGSKLVSGELTLKAGVDLNVGDALQGKIKPEFNAALVDTSAEQSAIAAALPAPPVLAAITAPPAPRTVPQGYSMKPYAPGPDYASTPEQRMEQKQRMNDMVERARDGLGERNRERLQRISMDQQLDALAANTAAAQNLEDQQVQQKMVAMQLGHTLAQQQQGVQSQIASTSLFMNHAGMMQQQQLQAQQLAQLARMAQLQQQQAVAAIMPPPVTPLQGQSLFYHPQLYPVQTASVSPYVSMLPEPVVGLQPSQAAAIEAPPPAFGRPPGF